jgi:hypothetical protein
MSREASPRRPVQCEDTTREGNPCPTNARRKADPDGKRRCIQHTIEPAVAEAIRLARHRGGYKREELVHAGPAVVDGTRYLTAEALDEVFDEALNVMRLELRIRKANKSGAATAIVALADAKLRFRQVAWLASAQRRLNPVPVREEPA